jgi:hypothetical protein
MRIGINQCDVFLLFLSPQVLISWFTLYEISIALRLKKKIVVIYDPAVVLLTGKVMDMDENSKIQNLREAGWELTNINQVVWTVENLLIEMELKMKKDTELNVFNGNLNEIRHPLLVKRRGVPTSYKQVIILSMLEFE